MRRCQQCGRPAVVRVSDKDGQLHLCIDCVLQLEHAEAMEFQRTAQQFNLAAAAFEAAAGLPGLVPRMPIPPVHIAPISSISINNINVDNSVIGVLNTCSIETVDNAVTVLKHSGAEQMESAISTLTQSVNFYSSAPSSLDHGIWPLTIFPR